MHEITTIVCFSAEIRDFLAKEIPAEYKSFLHYASYSSHLGSDHSKYLLYPRVPS